MPRRTKPTKTKVPPKGAQTEVAKTIGELCSYYDVTRNTITSHWLKDKSFPGKAAPEGKRNGYFPIRQIDEWLLNRERLRTQGPPSKAAAKAADRLGVANSKQADNDDSDKARKLRAEMQLAEIKVNERRRILVDRDVVRGEILRQHSIMRQTFLQLPHMLADVLPVDLDPAIKADFVRRSEVVVDKACNSFLEALEKA